MLETQASNTIPQPKTDPEYFGLISPMGGEEYQALVESIKTNGLLQPIVISSRDHTIIEGHNRYRACKELGIRARFIIMNFPDRSAEKAYIIESNLVRRHLNTFKKIEIALLLEPIEKDRAHSRRLRGLKNVGALVSPSAQNLGNDESASSEVTGEVLELLARKVQVSAETFRKARYLARTAPRELLEKLRAGDLSIHAAYEELHSSVRDSAAAMAAAATPGERQTTSGEQQGASNSGTETRKDVRGSRLTLASELYDNVIKAIELAKATGKPNITMTREKRKIISIESIENAT